MDTNPCPKSDELIPTSSSNMESTRPGKKNMMENCRCCGERLDPTGIVFHVNLLSVNVWCQNCDTKNYFGKIRKISMSLPSPPVIKRLAGYQLRERYLPKYRQSIFFDSSFSKKSSEEESPLPLTTENQGCISSFHRPTPEEISLLMCLEAQAKRRKREKLQNKENH